MLLVQAMKDREPSASTSSNVSSALISTARLCPTWGLFMIHLIVITCLSWETLNENALAGRQRSAIVTDGLFRVNWLVRLPSTP
jgi:hypothetical protein